MWWLERATTTWVICIWATDVMAAETAALTRDQHQVSFVCPAYKASHVQGQEAQFASCVELAPVAANSTVQVVFQVQELIPDGVDVARFGPTSTQNHKQSLDLTLTDQLGNLLNGHRHLALGESAVQIQSGSQPAAYSVCLLNLVYDGSWKSIDTDRVVTLTMDQVSDTRQWPSVLLTEADRALLAKTVELVCYLAKSSFGADLLDVESQRRDLNESTFVWVTYGQVMVVVLTLMGNCAVLSYVAGRLRVRRSSLRWS
ncbi:LAFE_0E09956g1_1 [Lachancea fermentati]|uniref:LAFE_0E09956g1_1 n=1 Tax=Lachancea fermentati TaxID=4955 RepID=A0A1G4MDG6_LACFM|nr:LAFE_0E09956g1_1 [Lachancea fermentati]